MHQYSWANRIIVLLGVVIAAAPLFSLQTHGILVHGGSIGFAVPFILKGTSRLRCSLSDVILTVLALTLVLLGTLVSPPLASPLAFEVGALLVIVIFAATGVTFKAIAREQRARTRNSC